MTVLALSPHTDDVELGSAGILAKFIRHGAEVHTVTFSICEKRVPIGCDSNILAFETQDAADTLGILPEHQTVFNYPVDELDTHRQSVLDFLWHVNESLNPDLVLCPASFDCHQDHRAIYEEAVRAFKRTTILGYEFPWNTIETARLNSFCGLADIEVEKKLAALKCYQSQQHRNYMSEDFIRSWLKVRGTTIGSHYAEAFEVVRFVMR